MHDVRRHTMAYASLKMLSFFKAEKLPQRHGADNSFVRIECSYSDQLSITIEIIELSGGSVRQPHRRHAVKL